MEKMPSCNNKNTLEISLSYLTENVSAAVMKRVKDLRTSEKAVSEIRLRLDGLCALVVGGRNIPLCVTVTASEIKEIFRRISGGAVFAHRDDLSRGFIALPRGIRVGIGGYARYENKSIVGVTDISSLVFRIPTGECRFARSLYGDWLVRGGGMLICASAGEGKTTAIRSLAGLIGRGERPRRVVVVDERCEFDPSEYTDAHVDILRGYRRALGIDIAIRTMSAEVLIVDEISSKADSDAMLGAMGAGVSVIATAHARSLADALKRSYIKELFAGGLFDSVCIVRRQGGEFFYSVEEADSMSGISLHGKGDI